MRQPSSAAVLLSLGVLPVLLAGVFTGPTMMDHERKEVAGLAVVFGAEPEPALTEEMQFLRWRVSSLADEEPYTDFQDAEVTITRDGEEYGPFPVRGSRRDPGLYQTRHIFTTSGEYESVLSFRKGEEEEVHTVDFMFRIRDRATLEIPLRIHGSSEVAQTPAEIVSAFHGAIASLDTVQSLGYLHPDVIIFESGRAEMSRDEFASGHLGADMSFAAETTREITYSRTILGGDVAVVMNRIATSGMMGDREINSVGVETVTLRREGGGWKIVHVHWSSRRQR